MALSATVMSLSATAFGQEAKSTNEAAQPASVRMTPPNTAPGETVATDISSMSTRSQRDFVANPTGLSVAGNLGVASGDGYGGPGIGGRIGYTFPARFYVGALFDYHFGSTSEAFGTSIRRSTYYFGPELGYDLGVGPMVVRPVLGLGVGFATRDAKNQSYEQNETTAKFTVSPGVEAMVPIGNFFVGTDARYIYMRDNAGLALFANGGIHL
jgi:hypothetical protein